MRYWTRLRRKRNRRKTKVKVGNRENGKTQTQLSETCRLHGNTASLGNRWEGKAAQHHGKSNVYVSNVHLYVHKQYYKLSSVHNHNTEW